MWYTEVGIEEVAEAGLKSMTSIFIMFRKNLFLFPQTLCHIFNVVVMPDLCMLVNYGDIW